MTDTPTPGPARLELVADDADPTRQVVRDLAVSLRAAGLELGALRTGIRSRADELGRRAEEQAAQARDCLERGAFEAAARHCHRAHACQLAAVSLGAVELGSRA